MSRLPAIQTEAVTSRASELLDAPQANLKITPNITRLMANTPAVLEGRRSYCARILKTACSLSVFMVVVVTGPIYAPAQDDDDSPSQLRQFIGQQVGGIDKLKVPATNAAIPVPRLPNGTVPYRYQTTEAKRYLGKLRLPRPSPHRAH